MPVLSMRSPLFGPCRLIPHTLQDEPTDLIGYVALEGEPSNVIAAIYQGGAWRGRDLKPLPAPILHWYSVEKADGSPLF